MSFLVQGKVAGLFWVQGEPRGARIDSPRQHRSVEDIQHGRRSSPRNLFLEEEHLKIINFKRDNKQQKLSWDDYRSMEFSRCVIKETLRLSSVAPFIPKEATEDVQYKDLIIPRGSLVIVHMRATQLDPFSFHNPMNFNPWRWLDECRDDLKMKRSYMPFGSGTRMCLGANLAQLEMAVLLHHIIINYEWEMAESDASDRPIYLPYLDFHGGLHIKIKALEKPNRNLQD